MISWFNFEMEKTWYVKLNLKKINWKVQSQINLILNNEINKKK
jgi:hypothetical protein